MPLMFGGDFLKAYYSDRRVLVTGSTGFKGSWLCRILTKLGAQVTGYALEPPTNPSLFEIANINDQIEQVIGDIRDYKKLSAVFNRTHPETVIHLAAQPLVIDSYADPRYTYETNVIGTVNVLECVRMCDSVTSFLNVTTDKVYENRELSGYGYREDDKLDGHDPYSNSKSCSELVTHSYAASFFSQDAIGQAAGRCAISTARAGNVFGGGDFSGNRIVPDCVRAGIADKPLIVRNPNSVRPYQHVLEPLVAYLIIAATQTNDIMYSGWYNIGPDERDCVTTGSLADAFAISWGEGFSWQTEHVDGPHEANFLKLDNSKIKEVFGWRPLWSYSQSIAATVEWTKAWLESNEAAIAAMDMQIDDYLEGLS